MATIQIKTEIPGPRSRALMKRRDAAVPRAPYNTTPVFAATADGATITDVDGNRYIDFAGGIGCLNIGHQAPRVTAAIREQLEKHLHLLLRSHSVRRLHHGRGEVERADAG